MKKSVRISIIITFAVVGIIITFAKVKHVSPLPWKMHDAINKPLFSSVANNGYDAVAYFIEKKPIKGNPTFKYNWKGADWIFSSLENRDLFKSNPEKFAPQFGGYCAFAVSKGFTANTNPEVFEIIDNKLYLFADSDVKIEWMQSQKENFKPSRENWK